MAEDVAGIVLDNSQLRKINAFFATAHSQVGIIVRNCFMEACRPKQRYTEYPGKDLEAMAFAVNYRRWIMDLLKPFLGRRIVEVGAGTGAFTEMLLETGPDRLTVLEPSPNLYFRLSKAYSKRALAGIVEVRQADFPGAFLGDGPPQKPDTAVYINVLEHIHDDAAELRTVFAALPEGGRILIFVPALPFLMSRIDGDFGHFRRYTLRDLQTKCVSAGFQIRLARYFDFLGVAPWWIKYCVLKSRRLESGTVRFQDRFIVPISRGIESIVTAPFGKNIIMVGEK